MTARTGRVEKRMLIVDVRRLIRWIRMKEGWEFGLWIISEESTLMKRRKCLDEDPYLFSKGGMTDNAKVRKLAPQICRKTLLKPFGMWLRKLRILMEF